MGPTALKFKVIRGTGEYLISFTCAATDIIEVKALVKVVGIEF